jgi:hypothetical protein
MDDWRFIRVLTPSSPLIRGVAPYGHAALMPGQAIFLRLFKKLPDASGRVALPDFGATPRMGASGVAFREFEPYRAMRKHRPTHREM